VEGVDAGQVLAAAVERGINLRRVDDTSVGVSLDETTTLAVVSAVAESFGAPPLPDDALDAVHDNLPAESRRTDDFLDHAVFHSYHSEHEMLRYLRRLADRDLALDRTMI